MKPTKEKIDSKKRYGTAECAKLLGYKSRDSVRYLIVEGYFPNATVVSGTPKKKIYKVVGQDLIDFIDKRSETGQ